MALVFLGRRSRGKNFLFLYTSLSAAFCFCEITVNTWAIDNLTTFLHLQEHQNENTTKPNEYGPKHSSKRDINENHKKHSQMHNLQTKEKKGPTLLIEPYTYKKLEITIFRFSKWNQMIKFKKKEHTAKININSNIIVPY